MVPLSSPSRWSYRWAGLTVHPPSALPLKLLPTSPTPPSLPTLALRTFITWNPTRSPATTTPFRHHWHTLVHRSGVHLSPTPTSTLTTSFSSHKGPTAGAHAYVVRSSTPLIKSSGLFPCRIRMLGKNPSPSRNCAAATPPGTPPKKSSGGSSTPSVTP